MGAEAEAVSAARVLLGADEGRAPGAGEAAGVPVRDAENGRVAGAAAGGPGRRGASRWLGPECLGNGVSVIDSCSACAKSLPGSIAHTMLRVYGLIPNMAAKGGGSSAGAAAGGSTVGSAVVGFLPSSRESNENASMARRAALMVLAGRLGVHSCSRARPVQFPCRTLEPAGRVCSGHAAMQR